MFEAEKKKGRRGEDGMGRVDGRASENAALGGDGERNPQEARLRLWGGPLLKMSKGGYKKGKTTLSRKDEPAYVGKGDES